MRAHQGSLLVGACLVWLTGACGGESAVPPSCPLAVSACPTTVPSYTNDVAPIIQQRCAPCHSPTGVEPNRPYQTYAQVKKFQIDILTQLHACPPKMPPAGAPQLSQDELNTVVGWLYCDAPNDDGGVDAGDAAGPLN